MTSILKPSKQKTTIPKIFGFDIETYGEFNQFYCASFWNEKSYLRSFHLTKEDTIKQLFLNRFKGSYIACTNLGFDFFGLLFGSKYLQKFQFIQVQSKLITATTYLKDGEFYLKRRPNSKKLTFIDTMNYATLSLKDLGELININKMYKPLFLGRKPSNDTQKMELLVYNMNDSKVSAEGLKFLLEAFIELGSSVKPTIASTSMSLFRNKYLDKDYFRHDTTELLEIFEGYYGGRTESFARGLIKDYNYYDVNSLYPSVMEENVFPDPNSKRITYKNTDFYINNYTGMSKIDIFCPIDMQIPLLPVRNEGKLIFPTGNLTGWYCHVEIKRAIDLGYTLKKVHKTYYYKETCSPFKKFVNDLYNKRLYYKSINSPMEYVCKILLNSLYGKFAQKFMDKDKYISAEEMNLDKLSDYRKPDPVGDFFRVTEDREPSCFCIPIWSAYVTSYARIKLHNYLKISDPVYCDTDSIITRKRFKNSKELGELKLEYTIKKGIIIKPKMYYIEYDNKNVCKIKGVGRRLCGKEFIKLTVTKEVHYKKFVKFKEAIRRDLLPNQIIDVVKHFNLEDDKRNWGTKIFSIKELQYSIPLNMDIINANILKLQDEKALILYEKEQEKQIEVFINSDIFDKESVGSDISNKEFIKNEQWFAENE